MVPEPRGGHHEWRLRSHFSSEATTTGLADGSRFWVFADLSLPCFAARHAATSSGDRPIQIRRLQPNEYIKVTRNQGYWKQGRPYLDGIDYTIIKNLSTANLAFIAGKFDMTFPYALSVPLLKDVNNRMPQAICELTPTAVNRNLIINRDIPPFDNPDLRRAMALS